MSKRYVAQSENLSNAWAEVFLELMRPGTAKLSPVVVTISEFDQSSLPVEHAVIRTALDALLQDGHKCRTVASTIFPNSVWRPADVNNAADLYTRYERIWPRVRRTRANSHGVYFRRLTAYSPRYGNGDDGPVNQLAHIVDTFQRGNHRHSALQAAIVDPTVDHSHQRQRGFPCLQQVSFSAVDGNLEVTGFYALQHHIAKSYGNYVGLCWLGRFMAQQMNLRLTRVTCISSMLELGTFSKTALRPLERDILNLVQPAQEQEV